MATDQTQQDGQPAVDYSNWSRPDSGDVRSPCPALNALANHNFLPHDGKNITKAMTVQALTTALHLDHGLSSIFAVGAIASNPDHHAHTFDLDHLDRHGFIEHDSSLSRGDIAFGSNIAFSPELWAQVLQSYQAADQTGKAVDTITWATAVHARYARLIESKTQHEQANKPWRFGIKEAIISYGESSLYVNVFGKDGVVPLQWIRTFFEEERLPYDEGWRPPTELVGQSVLNHGYLEMIRANPHAEEEAKIIGLSTLDALKATILSLGAGLIKFPSLWHSKEEAPTV